MKTLNTRFLLRTFALVITLYIVSTFFTVQVYAQQDNENYQQFYDQLSPYGQWIENSNYGYIWIPTAGPDFTPYLSNGYWLLTDYGWTWVSDYDWGWATFHYGRWDYNGSYGWFWVPDNEWGPSWVTWRRSNGYYGWAPMRPGVSISITFGRNNDVPYDRWIFVRDRDIERHDIDRNYIDRRHNSNIMVNSHVIDKTYYDNKRHVRYVAGPGREDVQKIIGKTIEPVSVRERDKPGERFDNDQLQIYMPKVNKNNDGHKPVPSHLTNYRDVKPISERANAKQLQNDQQFNSNARRLQQQPEAGVQNKINYKKTPIQTRNVISPDNKITNRQQRSPNPVNRIDSKKEIWQQRQLDHPQNDNKKVYQPTPENANPPVNNSNNNHPYQQRSLDPQKRVENTNHAVQPQNTQAPKYSNGTDRPPKVRTMNSPKNNNTTNDKPKLRTINPPRDNNSGQTSKPKRNEDK